MTLHTPPQSRYRSHSCDDATANQSGRWAANPVGITPGRFSGKGRGQFWSALADVLPRGGSGHRINPSQTVRAGCRSRPSADGWEDDVRHCGGPPWNPSWRSVSPITAVLDGILWFFGNTAADLLLGCLNPTRFGEFVGGPGPRLTIHRHLEQPPLRGFPINSVGHTSEPCCLFTKKLRCRGESFQRRWNPQLVAASYIRFENRNGGARRECVFCVPSTRPVVTGDNRADRSRAHEQIKEALRTSEARQSHHSWQ
jgi:hypothetical protein